MQSSVSQSQNGAAVVDAVLHRHGGHRHALVQILREVQEQTHWLPRAVLTQIASGVGLTPAIVEGVASFYRFFHLEPVAPFHLLWSDNITDRMLGNRALARDLCQRLNIRPSAYQTGALASVGFTSCTGLGDQGPALLVNQHHVITRMDAPRVAELAELVRAQVPVSDWPTDWLRVDDQVRRSDVLLTGQPPQGDALRTALARGSEATLAEVTQSGLRGRGGAGFTTGRKWTLCRQAPVAEGGTRVVVCNADEGEPGTFKDRVLLARQADAVFEGMTVAARILGARQGLVYLRGEYRYLLDHLNAVQAHRRREKLLGKDILGIPKVDFDIEIHVGAGVVEQCSGEREPPAHVAEGVVPDD